MLDRLANKYLPQPVVYGMLRVEPDPLSRLPRVDKLGRSNQPPLSAFRWRALKLVRLPHQQAGWFAAHLTQKTTGRYQESHYVNRCVEVEQRMGNPGNGPVLDPAIRLRPGRMGCEHYARPKLTIFCSARTQDKPKQPFPKTPREGVSLPPRNIRSNSCPL